MRHATVRASRVAGDTSDGRAARRAARPAPSLSSGWFWLPHLGDCTHEGQPSSQSQERDRLPGGGQPVPGCGEAALGEAGTAGVAVVDEDGELPGVRVQRGRDAADVPAVAGREQRQQADRAVLGGVGRAGQVAAGQPRLLQRRRPGRSTRPRRSTSDRSGRSSGSSPSTSPLGWRRLRKDTIWWVTSTIPKDSRQSPQRWCRRSSRTDDVGDLAGGRGVVHGRPGCIRATWSSRSSSDTSQVSPWCT